MEIFYTSDGRKFEGMSEKVVLQLIQDMKLSCILISQEQYNLLLAVQSR